MTTRAPAAPVPPLAEDRSALLPGGMLEDPVRAGAAAAGLVAVLLGLAAFGATTTVPSGALAIWLVGAVGVPLWLVALRPRRLAVAVALLAVLVPLGLRTAGLAEDPAPQESAHDGGVHVTLASAEDLLAGTNPYAATFDDDLPPSWMTLNVVPGEATPNPVVDHMPYLPGAFLVAVPGVLLERLVGVGGDPRLVMGLLVAAALVAVARRPEAEWARAATILAFGSSFVVLYAAWGTNDAAAAALVVLAALGAVRHPAWAGAALALAVAYKAPLALAVAPWALWIWPRGGWAALRRWWTFPTLLLVTTLPFAVWSPSDLLDDTLGFWSGTGEGAFPASGLGLGYRAPDLMSGPFGVVLTLGLLAGGLAAAAALVRKVDHPAVLPVASALVLLGLLIPARTFQPNYMALVCGLLAAGWLAVGARVDPPVAHAVPAGVGGSPPATDPAVGG